MSMNWYFHLVWILGAAVLGFAVTAILAGKLRLRRNVFLVPYVGLAVVFVAGYARWSQLDLEDLVGRNWPWGLLGAAVLSVLLVKNVQSQPASPRSTGAQLGFDVLWQGVAYGAVDAVLLSVLPVVAAWQAFSLLGWTTDWPGRLAVGGLAFVASLVVTFAYHWGYPEYHGPHMKSALLGNGMMTLGYLLTMNPIAALVSHAAMHVAGVLHGPEKTAQLPPHYEE